MHSVFDPASPQARVVAHLWWWMLGVGGAIWVAVIVAMLLAVFRGDARDEKAVRRGIRVAIYLTTLILVGFLAYDFGVGRALRRQSPSPLTIRIVGHQWWWEAIYEDSAPTHRFVTANEIHVPVGQPVRFSLQSADVIHSFWVPALRGKRDLVPGYTSTLWFTADTAGTYRGQCAEFCGVQHAKMAFAIIAESATQFVEWRSAMLAVPSSPIDSTTQFGQRVFMTRGCASCHTIGGTDARGTIGPNLTHLQRRTTIVAGSLPNTPGAVAGWIAAPSATKPGTRMPAIQLSGQELSALLAYLGTLK